MASGPGRAGADDNYHTSTDATSLKNCAGDNSNFGRCPGIPWMFWYPEFKALERAHQERNASYQGGGFTPGVSAPAAPAASPSPSPGGMGGGKR